MQIHYIDAENVGMSFLDELSISMLDRVFIFTHTAKKNNEHSNPAITYVSDYPVGNNQADFYIIGHLVSVLSLLKKTEKKAIYFTLHTKDIELWKAFKIQCSRFGVNAQNPYMKDASQPPQSKEIAQKTVSSPKNTSVVPLEISVENKILKLMSQPISAVAIQEKLNLTKPTFTLNFNSLIN
ncbi:MAG: hypothetical protein ACRDBT_08980 [Aeromonas sp.]